MNLRTRLTAGALGATLLLAAPSAAHATLGPDVPVRPERPANERVRPAGDLESLRARCLEAVGSRLEAIDEATARLSAHEHVTAEHQAALTAILEGTATSLESLSGDIAGAADLEALRTSCRSVFADHRVFALIVPRTRLVAASDTAMAVAGRLAVVADRLGEALTRAAADGRDVAGASARLEALRGELASARAQAMAVPESILPLTPADWNADRDVLLPARSALRGARTDLGEARALARGIAEWLRGEL